MVNASTSYVLSDDADAERTQLFLWSMIAVVLLDLMVLLWTLQPWAHAQNRIRTIPPPPQVVAAAQVEKPSPLGKVVQQRRRAAPATRSTSHVK